MSSVQGRVRGATAGPVAARAAWEPTAPMLRPPPDRLPDVEHEIIAARQLQRVLVPVIVVAFGFTIATTVSLLAFKDYSSAPVVIAIGLSGVAGIVGLRLLRHGRGEAAALLLWTALVVTALTSAYVAPVGVPALMLVPLLGFVIALPLLRGARAFAIAAATIGVIPVVLMLAWLSPVVSTAPPWVDRGFALAGAVTAVALVGHFMWRYDRRLRRALGRSRDALEALHVSHGELREMAKWRAQFISNAAHELKTPLTPIGIHLHMLRREVVGVNGGAERSLVTLERNFHRLEGLIKDLLDVSRLDSGGLTLHRHRVRLDAVVDEALEPYRPVVEDAHLDLVVDVDGGLEVDADASRLAQVVTNLLANAVKFTPGGGLIRVSTVRDGDMVGVRVADDGQGIAAEDLPRLFNPFVQVHDAQRAATGGTGLGLYICKGIVEAHGGRIWAESDGHGAGTSFTFLLPMAGARDDAADAPPVRVT